MKYLILLVLTLPAFSQKILKVKDDNVLISNEDLDLESGKKYYLETDSGESLIGVYTNGSSDSGYVAKILEGDLSEGDRITTHRKKKVSGGSMASGAFKKLRFGVHGGVNLASSTNSYEVTSGTAPEDDTFDASMGFQAGVNAQYNLNAKMGVNLKLSYNIHKFSQEGAVAEQESQVDFSSVSFQPTLKFHPIKFAYVFTGVRVAMPMSITQKTVDTESGEIIGEEVDLKALADLDDDSEISGMVLDIPLGIGFNFDMGKISLQPNFTYYLAMSSWGSSDDGTGNTSQSKMQTLAFNLDVLF